MPQVVKLEMNPDVLVGKYPDDSIVTGSQLVVYPSQTAFFVKGGRIFDTFQSGTYDITTENLPLLNKVLNIPYNVVSPFQAEVWFVNQISLLDFKWGTGGVCQITDPLYNIVTKIRAFGQYAIHIEDPLLFFNKIVGNMPVFSRRQLADYFRRKINTKLSSIIYEFLLSQKKSIVDAGLFLDSISDFALNALRNEFLKRGILLEDFTVMNISIDEEDSSFARLKKAIDKSVQIDIIGKDNYQMDRSLDVMQSAASNSGGVAGAMATAMIGAKIGQQVSGLINNTRQNQCLDGNIDSSATSNSNVIVSSLMSSKVLYYIYECKYDENSTLSVSLRYSPLNYEDMMYYVVNGRPRMAQRYIEKLVKSLDSYSEYDFDNYGFSEMFKKVCLGDPYSGLPNLKFMSKNTFIDMCRDYNKLTPKRKYENDSPTTMLIWREGLNFPCFYDEIPEFVHAFGAPSNSIRSFKKLLEEDIINE